MLILNNRKQDVETKMLWFHWVHEIIWLHPKHNFQGLDGWDDLSHPLHSPDLALSFTIFFESLKGHLSEKWFHIDDVAVVEMYQWDKYINPYGDNEEK